VSVDTYLKGKKVDGYLKLTPSDGVTVLVDPKLGPLTSGIEMGLHKKLIGSKLVVAARPSDSPICELPGD